MNDTNPELRAAIDIAKQRVKVDSYFTTGMNQAIKGRAQGYWAGTMLGILSGALIAGMILAVAPIAGIVITNISTLFLGIVSVGAVAGGMAGAQAGADTGVAAGIVGEFERRIKADHLEAEILTSPAKQAEVIAAYRANPVVEKKQYIAGNLCHEREHRQSIWQAYRLENNASSDGNLRSGRHVSARRWVFACG